MIQNIKRGIITPHFLAETHIETSTRMQRAYSLLAQQVNAIQSQFQVIKATYAAASPQTITLPIPLASTEYAVFAMPNANCGSLWITARTTTNFAFNMSAPAATTAWFLVVVGVNP